jgi:methyl-accepting chemotaxis protein
MKWFLNMKIGAKLITSFILMAIITVAVSIVGIQFMTQIKENATYTYLYHTQPISYLTNVATKFQQVRIASRDIITATTSQEIQKQADNIEAYRAEISKNADLIKQRIDTEVMQEKYERFTKARESYVADLETMMALAQDNRDGEATEMLNGNMKTTAGEEDAVIQEMVAEMVNSAQAKDVENEASA